MKSRLFFLVTNSVLLGFFATFSESKGTFYNNPYRYNLYTSGSTPHYHAGKPMSRHKNFCAYVVQKNISCTIQDGTATYVKAEYNKCAWGQKCSGNVMYRTYYKPKYKVGYKTVTELEWRCCPGFLGENCQEDPTGLPEMMPPFKGSMTPPGLKGHPRGHPRGRPEPHKPFPIGHIQPQKPFPGGHPEPQHPAPGSHMHPGNKKSYYARKFQGLIGERLDRIEEQLRQLSQSYDSLNGIVNGLEDKLRLALREDTTKMLGSLLSTPPRVSDSTIGFGVIPDGTPDGLEGGEGFPGFGDLSGRVTEVKDELRAKSEMLEEIHGMVLGHDGQLKHLIESAAGKPSPISSQQVIEQLLDSKLAGMRSDIFDGFEKRLTALENQCETRVGEVLLQCQQERISGQHEMEQSLDGRETGLRKEIGNLQTQIQGLTLTESCCTQVSSLSQRVLLLENSVKGLTESQLALQSSLDGQATQIETFLDGRLEEIEARLNASETSDPEIKMKGIVGTEIDGFKSLLDEKLKILEDRLFVAVEELSNATAPALLEGQAVPALESELVNLRKQIEGDLKGIQGRLTDFETVCSSACPHATGDIQKLQTEIEECLNEDKRMSGQLDIHADYLKKLNVTLMEILRKMSEEEEEGAIHGEITLLKINVNSVNRSLKGLQDSLKIYAQEVSHANSSWQQHELKIVDQVHGLQSLVEQQGSQVILSERRLQQIKGELQNLKRRLTGEVKGCKNVALGAQREVMLVDGRVTQVEGLCGNLGELAEDLEKIRGELEEYSNDYLARVNGTLTVHSNQLAQLQSGLKDCQNKTEAPGLTGDH
ncbi:EMILIN-3 [Erpetoichthys calabaricus]|uniref:Elastin microfibril interfacer 3 n=1 Tax=Erpetoichthys calabaricus TaxID=27687 RepID=A0A8C4S9I0_ERPCA|nr:EMILIN-3 [Erpetoichthys calabaricus]